MDPTKSPSAATPLLLSVLPIHAVEPTPFQRDLSDTHHKRLADVINKTGRFLDPIIAVFAPKDGFWTPNGWWPGTELNDSGPRVFSGTPCSRKAIWQSAPHG